MQTQKLSYRALLERVLPVERLSLPLQAEVASALGGDDAAVLEHATTHALRELEALGLVRPAPPVSAGDRRFQNLLTGGFITLRAREAHDDAIQSIPLPIADDSTTAPIDTARELVSLASRLLSEGGDQLAEGEQIIEILEVYGRQLLACDELRFIPLTSRGPLAVEVGAEHTDSPFARIMANATGIRRRQIVTIRDIGHAESGSRSFAAVPVGAAGDPVHGYLEARSSRPAHFTRTRLALLELLAETGNELLRNSSQLQKLVFIDSRTQIFNKSFFDIELAQFLARARREGRQMALAIADVDDFKAFNTRYGYHGGDQVLYRVAQILKSHVRPFDIVARWGGEEFAILLAPPVELSDAMSICDRLRLAVQQHNLRVSDLQGREHRVSVTISIGGSLYPYDGQTADELWRRANEALLVAKTAGKNLVRFRQRRPLRREARPAGA